MAVPGGKTESAHRVAKSKTPSAGGRFSTPRPATSFWCSGSRSIRCRDKSVRVADMKQPRPPVVAWLLHFLAPPGPFCLNTVRRARARVRGVCFLPGR
jgi:hypothetical protein